MLFNSYPFIFGFLPIALVVFFTLARFRFLTAATAWLLVVSLAFYSYWNIAYLPLMLLSIGVNYWIGRQIERATLRSKQAKIWLGAGIAFNLALLSYYKYANFFLTSIDQILGTDWILPDIVLPLGISFYTFTQTAYLVDAYRGETKQYNLLTYSLFVTFFPHLIAGPILHHQDMIPQFQRLRNFAFSHKNMVLGLAGFILGLAKKVLIADNLSPWVKPVFQNSTELTFIEAWAGAICYTLQLYYDFSGYSDMAVGLGWMLNINLPWNFNSPYKATSIIDFWRRWHITLSNFLRDYLYIPLGGNRKGKFRRYINLMITMLLGGLWHGAAWKFVLWGGLHGMYLCINHWWRKINKPLPKLLAGTITFICVVVGWVIFRAYRLQDAVEILRTMAGLKGIVLPVEKVTNELSWLNQLGIELQPWNNLNYLPLRDKSGLVMLVILLACTFVLPNTQQIVQRFKLNWWWATGIGAMAAACFLSLNRVSEFLYFEF